MNGLTELKRQLGAQIAGLGESPPLAYETWHTPYISKDIYGNDLRTPIQERLRVAIGNSRGGSMGNSRGGSMGGHILDVGYVPSDFGLETIEQLKKAIQEYFQSLDPQPLFLGHDE